MNIAPRQERSPDRNAAFKALESTPLGASLSRRAVLGESALASNGLLYSVDIPEALIFIDSLGTSTPRNKLIPVVNGQRPLSIGTVCLTQEGSLVLATSRGVVTVDPEFGQTTGHFGVPLKDWADREKDPATRLRFNDGKVGPDGCLYVGVMLDDSAARRANPTAGSLWRLTPQGEWSVVLEGLRTPNGICWTQCSSEQATVYFIDTGRENITSYDHNLLTGEFSAARVVIDLHAEIQQQDPATWGRPDGMTIAADGRLITAMYGGGKAVVINPINGVVEAVISVAAEQTTSVALGGDKLYVTTGAHGYVPADLEHYPDAGSIFVADLSSLGIRGVEPFRFGAPASSR